MEFQQLSYRIELPTLTLFSLVSTKFSIIKIPFSKLSYSLNLLYAQWVVNRSILCDMEKYIFFNDKHHQILQQRSTMD